MRRRRPAASAQQGSSQRQLPPPSPSSPFPPFTEPRISGNIGCRRRARAVGSAVPKLGSGHPWPGSGARREGGRGLPTCRRGPADGQASAAVDARAVCPTHPGMAAWCRDPRRQDPRRVGGAVPDLCPAPPVFAYGGRLCIGVSRVLPATVLEPRGPPDARWASRHPCLLMLVPGPSTIAHPGSPVWAWWPAGRRWDLPGDRDGYQCPWDWGWARRQPGDPAPRAFPAETARQRLLQTTGWGENPARLRVLGNDGGASASSPSWRRRHCSSRRRRLLGQASERKFLRVTVSMWLASADVISFLKAMLMHPPRPLS